jgi:hypothetical protein
MVGGCTGYRSVEAPLPLWECMHGVRRDLTKSRIISKLGEVEMSNPSVLKEA